jgi:hypothetical protein
MTPSIRDKHGYNSQTPGARVRHVSQTQGFGVWRLDPRLLGPAVQPAPPDPRLLGPAVQSDQGSWVCVRTQVTLLLLLLNLKNKYYY